jgi:hypothetical protein
MLNEKGWKEQLLQARSKVIGIQTKVGAGDAMALYKEECPIFEVA